MDKTRKKFLVVDGTSLAHRAFYALPLLTNRQGVFTNAAYGFMTMLLKILGTEKADYLAVAFDKGKMTFRHQEYQEYKGHRKGTPVELRPQFSIIKNLLQAMRVASFELDNYEADDLIGTLSKKAEAKGLEVLILTGDRDALQLISLQTTVFLTRKGISQIETFDLQAIREKYSLDPEQLIDVKGLMGDTSDNIPGVPGIGEKTAVKLIQQFTSLENLLDNLEQVSGKKFMENLNTYKEQALLSKHLATIVCDSPVEFNEEECLYQEPDYPKLLELYKQLDFNRLVKGLLADMPEEAAENRNKISNSLEEITSLSALEDFLQNLVQGEMLALNLELDQKNYTRANLQAVGLANSKRSAGIVVNSGLSEVEILTALKRHLEGKELSLILHDAKKAKVFFQKRGINLRVIAGDTLLGAYLLNPSASTHDLPEICLEHLDRALTAKENKSLELAERAEVVLQLNNLLLKKLEEVEMVGLYREIELPLVDILTEMEIQGVKLDLVQLETMGEKLEEGIKRLTGEIFALAGEEFNINSPKQLGGILFEKLGLPPLKKTKTGYSTNAEVLEELAPRHEIVAKILEYRQLVKLKSTYVDGLRSLVDASTDKVHTTFNQTITATGRLSSMEPNLQNIPVRLEQGRLIRKAFVPSEKDVLIVAADYSQIELRVLAHISGDANLIDAFEKKQDIHTRTAAEVFGVAIEQTTKDMRRKAKAVNFGIVYGISDYGLARDLGISRKEAGQYIDLYFTRYPGVKKYIDRVIMEAREKGFVTTLLNRRRYLPDLFSSNRNVRAFGERTAMNTPIQGSAADIIKLAMLEVAAALKEIELQAKMILQVHDELIFEVSEAELVQTVKLIKEKMEGALILQVPLEVDVKVGTNWYDLKSF